MIYTPHADALNAELDARIEAGADDAEVRCFLDGAATAANQPESFPPRVHYALVDVIEQPDGSVVAFCYDRSIYDDEKVAALEAGPLAVLPLISRAAAVCWGGAHAALVDVLSWAEITHHCPAEGAAYALLAKLPTQPAACQRVTALLERVVSGAAVTEDEWRAAADDQMADVRTSADLAETCHRNWYRGWSFAQTDQDLMAHLCWRMADTYAALTAKTVAAERAHAAMAAEGASR